MSLVYGIQAIMQSAADNRPHILGFQTSRSAADDTLFEVWNAASVSGIKAAIDFNGKFYSAALTAGDIQYAVAGGVTGVQRLDSLAIGTAAQVLVVNSGATAPEWTSSPTFTAEAGSLTGNTLASGVTASSLTSVGDLSALTVYASGVIQLSVTGTAVNSMLIFSGPNAANANGNNLSCLLVSPNYTNIGAYTSVTGKGLNVSPQFGSSGSQTFSSGIGLVVTASAGGTPTVTTWRGIHIDQPAGTIMTTSTGLWIGDHDAASTNYAIYTGSGLVRFGDAVSATTTLAVGGGLATGSALSVVRSLSGDGAARYGIAIVVTDDTATGNVRTGLLAQIHMGHSSGTQSADVTGFHIVAGVAAAATVTNTYAIRASIDTYPGATMTNAYFLEIDTSIAGDVGVIGTEYGLHIGDVDDGSTNYAIYTGTGLVRFGDSVEIDGDLNHDGSNIGFFGTAPTTKQEVTGSRGANAALASLLTALAAYGLLTDSSS